MVPHCFPPKIPQFCFFGARRMKKLRKRTIKRRQLKFRFSRAHNKCACVAQVCAYAHMPTYAYARVWKKRRAGKTPYAQKKTNTASSDNRINFAILIFRPIRQTKSVRRSFPFDFLEGKFFTKIKNFQIIFENPLFFSCDFFVNMIKLYCVFDLYIQ